MRGRIYVKELQGQRAPELHEGRVFNVEVVTVALPVGVACAEEYSFVVGGGVVAHWPPHQCQRDTENERNSQPREAATNHGVLVGEAGG